MDFMKAAAVLTNEHPFNLYSKDNNDLLSVCPGDKWIQAGFFMSNALNLYKEHSGKIYTFFKNQLHAYA